MVAYTLSVPVGVPGTVTDFAHTVVRSMQYNPALMPASYGAPIKLVAGLVSAIEAGDDETDVYGVLARSNPGSSGDPSFNGFGAGSPVSTQIPGVAIGPCASGRILVNCTVGDPVNGGIVYMRVVDSLPKLVGDFEATADGVNSVALTNLIWYSTGKDPIDGTAEVLFK